MFLLDPASGEEIVGWKIWYGDGTTACSSEDEWERCKADNVQVILLYHNGNPDSAINAGEKADVLFARMYAGKHDPSEYSLTGSTHIKTGDWLPDGEYEAMRVKAQADFGNF